MGSASSGVAVRVVCAGALFAGCVGPTATANVAAGRASAAAAIAMTAPGATARVPVASGDPRAFPLSAADAREATRGLPDDDDEPRATVARLPREQAPWNRCTAVAGEWSGTVRGNDPHAQAQVTLAVSPDCRVVQGLWRWRSPCSGAVDRTVTGEWDPAARTLVLRDVALTNPTPHRRARFCMVDRYELALSSDGARLDGAYDASGCRDHARIELARAH